MEVLVVALVDEGGEVASAASPPATRLDGALTWPECHDGLPAFVTARACYEPGTQSGALSQSGDLVTAPTPVPLTRMM